MMEWNQAQQKAIEGRGKNILVSAAAGSGKTAVLVERIKQLIIKDKTDIDRMLIVTFTNAAAGEMKERITKAISEEIYGKEASFLREQLRKIHNAQICTFHSFCMDVIRRYFYLLDIKPDVRICDEAQESILQQEAMEMLFAQRFETGEKEFLTFLHKYAGSKNENLVKTMIKMVYRFIRSIPEPLVWLRKEIEALKTDVAAFETGKAYQYAMEQVGAELMRAMDYFIRVESLAKTAGLSGILAKAQNDRERLQELIDLFGQNDHNLFMVAISSIKFETFIAKKEEKEVFETVKEEIKFLRDRGKAIIKTVAEKYVYKSIEEMAAENNLIYTDASYLYGLVSQFHETYAAIKAEKALIDFHDTEHFALAILACHEAAEEYRERFEYIFIDEYQDSNMVQETLIDRIRRENNLFMVGDVKQSIYKFRQAQPEIFMDKYDRYKSGREANSIKIDLNQNFRSKTGVIDFTNLIFTKVMTKYTCGMDYDKDARLYQGLSYSGALTYPAAVYLVDEAEGEAPDEIDDEIREMKKTELEAAAAARIIKETVGTLIFDDKKGMERRMEYRDIVILFRAVKGPGAIYQEILEKENIPVYAELDDGYFDTLEVGTFLNLLRIIDNRRQDIPLLSVLRSAVGGFSTDELVWIRLSMKDVPFHEAFLASETEKCETFSAKLEKWRELSRIMPLETFLWELMQDSGYYEYVGAMPGGLQRKANLRILADKAASFQNGQTGGIFGFINYVEQLKKTEVSMGQARLLGENDDVIRLMTVHKSKGLEFPAVIVAGLGRRFNMTRDSYQVNLHRDIGFAMRYVREEDFAGKRTFAQEVIEQRERKESLAEEMRILYVAFTRARDKLILLGTLKDVDASLEKYRLKGNLDIASASHFLDWILPAMEGGPVKPVVFRRADMNAYKEQTGRHKETIRTGILNGFAVKNPARKEVIEKRLSWQYPYQEASLLPSKYAASEVRKIVGGKLLYNIPELEVPQKLAEKQSRLTAAEKGTVMHRVIQHLDLKKTADRKAITWQIKEMAAKEILTEEEAEAVDSKKVAEFLESAIGKRMRAADKIHREMAFILKKPAKSFISDMQSTEEEILIQGAIDCYFEEKGQYILVDYKTDRTFAAGGIENMIEKYRPQLALYKEALEVIRGITVHEAYLYLFDIDQAIFVEV